MKKSITRTITGFAIAIVIVLAIGILFSLYTDTLSQERQDAVLFKAIPFVTRFVAVLLAYICLIAVLAVVLNGKVPPRTHRPIEFAIIAGILLGVVGLFQGWKLFVYQNGFLLLLVAVLSFIMWSHVLPMPTRAAKQLAPFSRRAQITALVVAAIVWAVIAVGISARIKPQAPYGVSPRVWDMMMSDEERAAMDDDFDTEYATNRIPVAALISLLPASIVFFAAREIAAAPERRRVPGMAQSISTAAGP